MADLDAAANVYNQCNNITVNHADDDGSSDDFADDVADLHDACRKYLAGTDRGYLLAARGVVNGDLSRLVHFVDARARYDVAAHDGNYARDEWDAYVAAARALLDDDGVDPPGDVVEP